MDELSTLIEEVRQQLGDLRQRIAQLDAGLEVSRAARAAVFSGSRSPAVHPSTAALIADIFRSARVESYRQSYPCAEGIPPAAGRGVGALRLVHSIAPPSPPDRPPAFPSLPSVRLSNLPALFLVSPRPSRDSGTAGGAAC